MQINTLAEQVEFIPPGHGLRITGQGHRYLPSLLQIQRETFAQKLPPYPAVLLKYNAVKCVEK